MDIVFTVLLAGQSNISHWFYPPNDVALSAFEEVFLEFNPQYTDVRFYNAAAGGTAILSQSAADRAVSRERKNPGSGGGIDQHYWFDETSSTFGPIFERAATIIQREIKKGAEFDAIIWAQGEGDIWTVTERNVRDYEIGLEHVLTGLRDLSGADHVYIQSLGDLSAPHHKPGTTLIRQTQEKLAQNHDWVDVATTVFDLPLGDSVHLTTEGYIEAAERMAYAISFGTQPIFPTEARISSTRVEIDFELGADETLKTSDCLSGFGVAHSLLEAAPKILTCQIEPEGQVVLTLSEVLDHVEITYASAAISPAMSREEVIYVTGKMTDLPVMPFVIDAR